VSRKSPLLDGINCPNPSSFGAATVSGGSSSRIEADQIGVEEFVTHKYLTIMDSVQNVFREYRETQEQRIHDNLVATWGEDGDARRSLEKAEYRASSKSRNELVLHLLPKGF
jgi:hypothetical protein